MSTTGSGATGGLTAGTGPGATAGSTTSATPGPTSEKAAAAAEALLPGVTTADVATGVAASPARVRGDTAPGAPPGADGERPYRWRWFALAVVLGAEIMDLLDATITSIAGPAVRAALDGSAGQLQWFSAAYTLAFAMFLIAGARLGDIHGRRRVFLVGVAAFTLTSALCGLSVSPEMLIGARALQGLAAALMVPQGFGLLRDLFPPDQLGAAFAVFGPVMGLASIGGPLLGGVLADADVLGLGWRVIFFVNVPFGVATFLLASWLLPRPRLGAVTERPRLDVTGVVLVTVATLLVVHPLVQGREAGWPAWTWWCMAAAVPVTGLFVAHERRVRARGGDALVEPGLFRNRAFSGALVVGLAIFASMIGLMFTLALYLQSGLGRSVTGTALAMVPWSLGMALGAGLAGGLLAPRFGRHVLHGGLLLAAAGVAALALTVGAADGKPSNLALSPALVVAGAGMGLAMAPFFDIALAGVKDHEVGSASGTLNAVQQLAGTLGVAVLGTVFLGRIGGVGGGGAGDGGTAAGGAGEALAESAAGAAAWVARNGDAFAYTTWIMAAVMLAAAALTFLMPRRAREEGTGTAH